MSATRTGPNQLPDLDTSVAEWPVEWAVGRAAEAIRGLGRNYPEYAASEALRPHEQAVNAAALVADDKDAYLKALRAYIRAGRDEALRIRWGAA